MEHENNPFKAPSARVEDERRADGYIVGGRVVPASHGIDWIKSGWALFREAPLPWIGLAVLFLVISVVIGMIPVVNFALNLLVPVFVGGIMLGCKALKDGEGLSVGHLFAGFSGHAGKLIMIGLLYLGAIIVLGIVLGVGTALTVGTGMVAGTGPGAILGGLVAVLIGALVFVPLAMAVWYAPPLVVFHDEAPWQAIKSSFSASLRNFLAFLLYGLVFVVLAILASLPLFLGWLVLMPVLYGSTYAAYRDIFVGDEG